jgi:hypothetical protein
MIIYGNSTEDANWLHNIEAKRRKKPLRKNINLKVVEYGTENSGNWGHAGIPGQRGGSNQTSGATGDRADRIRAANKAAQQKYQAPIKAARAEARAKAKAEKDAQAGESPKDAAQKKADEEAAAKANEEANAQAAEKIELKAQDDAVVALEKVGGREWSKGDKRRVYFAPGNVMGHAGIKIAAFGKGGMSKSAASKLQYKLDGANLYYDVKMDSFRWNAPDGSETDDVIRDALKSLRTVVPKRNKGV